MNRSPFFSSVAYFWNTSLNFSVVARLICACGPFYWIEKEKQRKRNETKKMRKKLLWMTKWKRVNKLYKEHSFKCFAELFCAAIISPSNEFRMHSLRVLFLFFFYQISKGLHFNRFNKWLEWSLNARFLLQFSFRMLIAHLICFSHNSKESIHLSFNPLSSYCRQ